MEVLVGVVTEQVGSQYDSILLHLCRGLDPIPYYHPVRSGFRNVLVERAIHQTRCAQFTLTKTFRFQGKEHTVRKNRASRTREIYYYEESGY